MVSRGRRPFPYRVRVHHRESAATERGDPASDAPLRGELPEGRRRRPRPPAQDPDQRVWGPRALARRGHRGDRVRGGPDEGLRQLSLQPRRRLRGPRGNPPGHSRRRARRPSGEGGPARHRREVLLEASVHRRHAGPGFGLAHEWRGAYLELPPLATRLFRTVFRGRLLARLPENRLPTGVAVVSDAGAAVRRVRRPPEPLSPFANLRGPDEGGGRLLSALRPRSLGRPRRDPRNGRHALPRRTDAFRTGHAEIRPVRGTSPRPRGPTNARDEPRIVGGVHRGEALRRRRPRGRRPDAVRGERPPRPPAVRGPSDPGRGQGREPRRLLPASRGSDHRGPGPVPP